MKVLSIGNSFSVDSQRYVREIAAADGVEIELGNLYIGGCSLERHCENMISGKPAYEYYINNKPVGAASLLTGLMDAKWDVITMQQASHLSGEEETYYPYLLDLTAYVKEKCPEAKLLINETWAYEYNSTQGAFVRYNNNRHEMHERLEKAYIRAAKTIGAGIIPVGKAIDTARALDRFDPEKGGIQLSRDGFHLSYQLGRFTASAVWYEILTGNDVRKNTFVPHDCEYIGRDENNVLKYRIIQGSEADAESLKILKEISHNAAASAKDMLK